MRSNKILAAVAAAALTAALPLAAAAPAVAATPGESLSSTAGFGGYSTGSAIHAQAVSPLPTALANLSLAQAAAGATVGEDLVTEDLLESTILFQDPAGKNAYGHGSAANVGVGQDQNEVPQIAPSTAEALSPPPTVAEPTELLTLPADPLATAQLLPSTAQAQTTSLASICPTGGSLISEGTAEVANARLLSPGEGQNVVLVGDDAVPADGVSSVVTQTALVPPSGGAAGAGLTTVTTQSIAPITLFSGIEGAETTIQVLRDLQVRATATGGTGSSIFYGFVNAAGEPVPDSEEVLRINDTVLTSEQVLGGDGLQLSLGVADIFIGAPLHGLDDDPTTDPRVESTTVAGAVDFIRIKVPGTVAPGTTMPVAEDSPLAPVLNPVLTPVIEGLSPVLEAIQQGLRDAGLEIADVRVGHFEALATVPAGGILCPDTPGGDDPLREAMKDVSTLSVAPGGTFDYTIRFPNRGDAPITNVRVVDTYSAALEFVSSQGSVTPAAGGDGREIGQPTRDGNVLTYDVGTLEPGDFGSITITFRVPTDADDGTVYRNEARITGEYKGNPIEKVVDADGPTVITNLEDGCNVQRSTKFASNLEVVTGQVFAYYINVSNSGDEACTGIVVTDELDDGVDFVACVPGCTESDDTVTFDEFDLASGSARTLTIVVKTTATEGNLPNTGVITPDNGEPARPSTPGPRVTDVSVPSPDAPAGCPATGCGPTEVRGGTLARTGLASTLPVLGALVLLMPLVLRRRRGDLTG